MNTDPEIEAMRTIQTALTKLDDPEARARLLRWALDRFGTPALQTPTRQDEAKQPEETDFSEVANLRHAADPKTDAESALVVGYWFQVIGGADGFTGQQVTTELKQLGHNLSNVTMAMSSLINRKPSLAMQTRKSGTTRQARKRYKLTVEGVRRVEEMLRHEQVEE